jgi:hypothetical protein
MVEEQTGMPTDALASFSHALAIHEALALAYPGDGEFQNDLAAVHAHLARTQSESGRFHEAQSDLSESERILEKLPVVRSEMLVALASGYAALSGSVERYRKRTLDGETFDSDALAEKAIATLRRAVSLGWKEPEELHRISAFGRLASRRDFQDLVRDLGFPATRFTH